MPAWILTIIIRFGPPLLQLLVAGISRLRNRESGDRVASLVTAYVESYDKSNIGNTKKHEKVRAGIEKDPAIEGIKIAGSILDQAISGAVSRLREEQGVPGETVIPAHFTK